MPKAKNFSVISINGGQNNQSSPALAVEANSDAQIQAGVGFPVPLFELSMAGTGPVIPDAGEAVGQMDNEPYIRFLQGILALSPANLPQVISISYLDDEQTWPVALAKKICNMFAQLGSRGGTLSHGSIE